jgi:hypothetical protein
MLKNLRKTRGLVAVEFWNFFLTAADTSRMPFFVTDDPWQLLPKDSGEVNWTSDEKHERRNARINTKNQARTARRYERYGTERVSRWYVCSSHALLKER